MLKTVLFDFDGTLADSKDVFVGAFNQLAEKYRFEPMRPEELESLRKLSIADRCRRLNFPLYKLPFFSVELYRLYRQSAHDIRLFPGVPEMLQELQVQGYGLGIISSNSEATIRAILQQHGLGFLTDISCSNRIFGKDKLLRNFLKKHKLASQQVIYTADEVRDIIACRQTQIPVIWVSWGYDAIEQVEKQAPDYIAHSPAEILQLVQQLRA